MAKQALAANRQRIWAFGQSIDFHIVTTTVVLNADNYSPTRHQKSQIVLHCTAGTGDAEQNIAWWNDPASGPASAHYVVERPHTAQAARPAGAGADQSDAGLVDAVRVLDDEVRSFHGGTINDTSIGIEIVNVGWGWFASLANRDEPTLTGRHFPLATCPALTNIGSTATPNWVCNHARPADTNRYIRLAPAIGGFPDYQSFTDQQYAALILLLRHLCIRHRIPRKFLGTNQAEVFRHYETDGSADERRVNKNILMRFRGIFAHRNAHPDKMCPGILNRNRLYRGIIDEWWLPVQRDGVPRAYYSGPFAEPPYPTGGPSRNSHFRFTAARRIEGIVYRAAQIDALIETRSYYDLDQVDAYFADTETRLGGMFPVGVNKVWHGGVHLPVRDSNPCVYAAASGTIVAARLSSNADTDRHPTFGSQRFVLIRHAVYRQLEADPGGLGQRINYTANPVFVFSLYMHLAAVRDPAREHDENPPWFNLWRRDNPGADIGMDGDKGRVFAPNIQVSVGDILGFAGTFRGRRMIHFEIVSHRNTELAGAPWNDANKRFVDTDTDVVCNVPALDRYLRDQTGDGIDVVDVLRAAEVLRDVKAMHKSEWALTSDAQIAPLVPHPDRRAVLWPHFRRFSWVAEAIAANPRLQRELGDASGILWHYHPILFMHHINTLVVGENREIRESEDHTINVETDEDYFLTNFVNWSAAAGSFAAVNVDNRLLHPVLVSSTAQDFRFSRRDISCFQTGAHNPGLTPPQSTRFSLALLEVLERIRRRFDANMEVTLSFVCTGHGSNNTLCVMNDADAMSRHRAGVAVDFRPAGSTPANCRNLWNSVVTIINTLNPQYAHLCGTPTQANFPSGYRGIRYGTSPAAVDAKLRSVPQQALTAAEAAAFRIHMEFIPEVSAAARPDTSDLPVKLRVTFEEIQVLDDQDVAGSAEWYLHANVNGSLAGKFSNRDVDTGDVIRVNWVKEVTLQPDGNLELYLTGRDAEVFSDDSLGEVSLTFNRSSSPPWSIGRRSTRSSNGSFLVTYRIESLVSEEL